MGLTIYSLFLIFVILLSYLVLIKSNVISNIKSYGKKDLAASMLAQLCFLIMIFKYLRNSFITTTNIDSFDTEVTRIIIDFFGDSTAGILFLYLVLLVPSAYILSMAINRVFFNSTSFKVKLSKTLVICICAIVSFSNSKMTFAFLLIEFVISVILFSLSDYKNILSRKKIVIANAILIISMISIIILNWYSITNNIIILLVIILEMALYVILDTKICRLRSLFELLVFCIVLVCFWHINEGIVNLL